MHWPNVLVHIRDCFMKKDIVDALVSIGGKFEVKDTYSTLVWKDDVIPKPTEKEINDEIAKLQADYDAKQYQRDREEAYPSIQEQLDMQYWDAVNGTKKWQESVAKVKTDNPKPE